MNTRVRIRMDYIDATTEEPKHLDESFTNKLGEPIAIEINDQELMTFRVDVWLEESET